MNTRLVFPPENIISTKYEMPDFYVKFLLNNGVTVVIDRRNI